jgi:hypothetical protein
VKKSLAIVFLWTGLCMFDARAATPTDAAGTDTAAPTLRPDPCAEPKKDGKKAVDKKPPAASKAP